MEGQRKEEGNWKMKGRKEWKETKVGQLKEKMSGSKERKRISREGGKGGKRKASKKRMEGKVKG